MLEPVIKWSGSKRHLAEQIINYFPTEINTYFEPFTGGGSIIYRLVGTNIKINKYVCSDLNKELIDFYTILKADPEAIYTYYLNEWEILQEKGQNYYYQVRDRFNKEKSGLDLFFLSRTCTNGLIRYNQKGEFNNSFHLNRKGISPDNMWLTLMLWSSRLKNVELVSCSFIDIQPDKNDYVYCDPPYYNVKGMYFKDFKSEVFFEWLANLPCKYSITYDGNLEGDVFKHYLPEYLWRQHILLDSGNSSYRRLFANKAENKVFESLYLNH